MSDKISDTHDRPALSILFLLIGIFGILAAVWRGASGEGWDMFVIGAALSVIALAEILNYLAHCAWRLDQIGKEAAHANALRTKAEAEAKLAEEADKHRDEVRAIAANLKPS